MVSSPTLYSIFFFFSYRFLCRRRREGIEFALYATVVSIMILYFSVSEKSHLCLFNSTARCWWLWELFYCTASGCVKNLRANPKAKMGLWDQRKLFTFCESVLFQYSSGLSFASQKWFRIFCSFPLWIYSWVCSLASMKGRHNWEILNPVCRCPIEWCYWHDAMDI